MAYVYVKNPDDALDVVQEVAYQAFKKIHTLRQPAYFKTWLLKITMNCATNVVRRNKKVIQWEPQYEETIAPESEDIPLHLTLQDLMEGLEEVEKSVVLLKFYEQYTFKEIADALDMPLGTAKSILYRSLQKLRKQCKENDRYEQ
ncbi:RNA polymerase sigma factor [Sporosarcina sp. PTS2304]|uniref:RNA polymerase sigma factor n=1 Tax=Sporosarcina sp. PTS2304 TaxID=2283194 RepID=UPI00352C7D31